MLDGTKGTFRRKQSITRKTHVKFWGREGDCSLPQSSQYEISDAATVAGWDSLRGGTTLRKQFSSWLCNGSEKGSQWKTNKDQYWDQCSLTTVLHLSNHGGQFPTAPDRLFKNLTSQPLCMLDFLANECISPSLDWKILLDSARIYMNTNAHAHA